MTIAKKNTLSQNEQEFRAERRKQSRQLRKNALIVTSDLRIKDAKGKFVKRLVSKETLSKYVNA